MCVVSMIGDHYSKKFEWVPDFPTYTRLPNVLESITREEFENLKREVLEMKELLRKAKIYDMENGEPDCEVDDKMEKLRRIADIVEIDINDVIGKK